MSALQAPPSIGVSDEVWAALDPYAGRLSRRAARGYRWLLAILIALIVVIVTLLQLGVITVRVSGQVIDATADRGSHVATFNVTMRNDGRRAARVVKVVGGRGVEIGPVGGLPLRVAGHSTASITIRAVITNCKQAKHERTLAYARVSRFWGDQSQPILTRPSTSSLVRTACRPPIGTR